MTSFVSFSRVLQAALTTVIHNVLLVVFQAEDTTTLEEQVRLLPGLNNSRCFLFDKIDPSLYHV